MEASVEQDVPSPRKRRKTEEDPNSRYFFGKSTEFKNFEGIGLLSQNSPRTIETLYNSSNQRQMENNIPNMDLLPSDEKRTDTPSPKTYHSQNNTNGPQIDGFAMAHTDPQSTACFANNQGNLKLPSPTRPREDQQKGGLSSQEDCVKTNESQTLDPAWNLQTPPRVYVRSNSAFPESADIHPNTNSHSAAVQFDRSRRVNSQPALMRARRDIPLDHTLRSIAKEMWNPSQRSSERAPLLRNTPKMETEAATYRSQTYLCAGPGTDDGVNEGLQHIGKNKGLWFVAISILVGIFLCLFMYAFHILK